MDDIRPPIGLKPERFIDQLRRSIRDEGLSYETEKTYVHWSKRFIRHHGFRHPNDMGSEQVTEFLTDLAERVRVAPATQRTALNALVFLFQRHLKQELGMLPFRYAKQQRRMPTAFTHAEATAVIEQLDGDTALIARLMYGAGLRVSEALRLRIKDIDFGALQITVRDGKGSSDRCTLLPTSVIAPLTQQIEKVEKLHAFDTTCGYGEVYLPYALARKYPELASETAWQFLFPAREISADPIDGTLRRHHRHPTGVQRAVKYAIRASGFKRKASCHTFRHSFATRLIETGYDIKLVQSLLGHKDIRTTEIYLHVVRNRAGAIVSPVDN